MSIECEQEVTDNFKEVSNPDSEKLEPMDEEFKSMALVNTTKDALEVATDDETTLQNDLEAPLSQLESAPVEEQPKLDSLNNILPIISLTIDELPHVHPSYPLDGLTPTQLTRLDELKDFLVAIISRDQIQGQKERRWCNDACLLRYLRATKWKVGDAMMRLKETLVWRRKFKPDEIKPEDIADEAVTGKQFLCGFDKLGHPIVF